VVADHASTIRDEVEAVLITSRMAASFDFTDQFSILRANWFFNCFHVFSFKVEFGCGCGYFKLLIYLVLSKAWLAIPGRTQLFISLIFLGSHSLRKLAQPDLIILPIVRISRAIPGLKHNNISFLELFVDDDLRNQHHSGQFGKMLEDGPCADQT
jgi:hypothetical protein